MNALPALATASLLFLSACSSVATDAPAADPAAAPPPVTAAAAAPAPAAKPGGAAQEAEAAKTKDDAKAKADARKQKQKELRQKQRELAAAGVEQQVAELDRGMRQATIDAQLAKTADELQRAEKDLEVFVKEVMPRELEQKRIQLDGSTYRAEHSKDELGELTAMYDADEFARTTKELVLKRGRRDLEMAERQLAVATKEALHFENVVMPQRLKELQQKVADAKLERKKAQVEAEKAKFEFALAVQKAADRRADLEEDVADLQQTLAKEQS
jgi:hypothetical protein